VATPLPGLSGPDTGGCLGDSRNLAAVIRNPGRQMIGNFL
jgi:hypothetical protein